MANEVITKKTNGPDNYRLGDIFAVTDDCGQCEDWYILTVSSVCGYVAVSLITGDRWKDEQRTMKDAVEELTFWGRNVKIQLEK